MLATRALIGSQVITGLAKPVAPKMPSKSAPRARRSRDNSFKRLWATCARRSRLLQVAAHSAPVKHLLGEWLQKARIWQRQRATKKALDALDDRALHDIGLIRSEIDRVAYRVDCANTIR